MPKTATEESLETLLDSCRSGLALEGLNLWGVVDAPHFDQGESRGRRLGDRMSGCRSAVVVGAGGNGPTAGGAGAASDRSVARTLRRRVRALRRAGLAARLALPGGRSPLNFLRLGEEAGLGVVSPVIYLLIHPRFGPWITLHGAILLGSRVPASRQLEDFAPCATCSMPCLPACPVGVFSERGADYLRCGEHRSVGGCLEGCAVLCHCPVGSEHRFPAKEEALRGTESLAMIRRFHGMGWWGLVPKPLRR